MGRVLEGSGAIAGGRRSMRIMKSEEVTSALERAAQLAERLRGLSEDERKARFFENLEKIRAEAIEKGIAIDDERGLGKE